MNKAAVRRRFGFAPAWCALVSAAVLSAYAIPNDALAAFNIFPAWTWTSLAIAPMLVRFRRYDPKLAGGMVFLTLVVTLATTEEWHSLTRIASSPGPESVRIAVLNCATSADAANEVAVHRPDLVILTENPGRPVCEKLALRLFGTEGRAVVGPDGAVVARAPLRKIDTPRGTHDFTAVTTSVRGVPLGLVALRLMPPEFNVNLLDPDAWRSVARNRRERRQQLARLAAWVRERPEIRLMAGDFNCQPWDPALSAMPEGFRDAFPRAGTGWGHTAVNDYPLARIDQIWTKRWNPARMWVVKTENSDHRMVLADFEPPLP